MALEALTVGIEITVTWSVGSNAPEVSRMVVVKATRRSVTLRDLSGQRSGAWKIKFADVGNESPFANRLLGFVI